MSNLGPVYEDNENYSPSRSNAKQITRDTGSNLVAIASTKQLGAVCPTDTSGGLIKNVLYVCDYDANFTRLSFIPVFGKHLHDIDSTEAGGLLSDIYQANSGKAVEINATLVIDDSLWHTAAVGTGAAMTDATPVSNDTYLEFKTGIVANNLVTSRFYGLLMSFASKMSFQHNLALNVGTSLLIRTGVNVDRIQDSQDTARRQYGLEGCDGHGVNWVMINANGNSGSLQVTATTLALADNVENNYKLLHTPATECRVYKNGVSNAVSTTNVASTGDTNHALLYVAGVKTTSTTEKIMKIWQAKITGVPGTNQLF